MNLFDGTTDMIDYLSISSNTPLDNHFALPLVSQQGSEVKLADNELLSREKALNELVVRSKETGYLLSDQILDASDVYDLSFQDVDWLSGEIALRGILIYDESPLFKKKEQLQNSYRQKTQDELEDEFLRSLGIELDGISIPVNASEDDDETFDYAQLDYSEIYRRVISLDPSLTTFINEVEETIPPQHGEFKKLIVSAQEGNQFARNRIIESHLRIAVRVALQRAEKYDQDISECISLATMGLLTAVDKYTVGQSGPFGSYCSFWMFQYLGRMQQGWRPLFRFPVHMADKAIAAYPRLKSEGFIEDRNLLLDTDAASSIAELLEVSEQDSLWIIYQLIEDESFDDENFYSEDYYNQEDTLEYPEYLIIENAPDEQASYTLLKEQLLDVLLTLTPREEKVLRLRFGLDDDKPKSLDEVGKIFNVTRERIRQIEAKALRKMRHPSRSKKLRDFLD